MSHIIAEAIFWIGVMLLYGYMVVIFAQSMIEWRIIGKLDQIDQLLKTKHDNAFVHEQNQEKADFYAELLALLREARHL